MFIVYVIWQGFLSTTEKLILCSTYIFIIPELGEGWFAAVPKNEVERNIVRRSLKELENTTPFWIGGSINPYQSFTLLTITPIQFIHYRTDDAGE